METENNSSQNTFESLGIAPDLLHAIRDLGFEHPMPIQQLVIPHLLEKDGDVVGLAQTGTGKTAAFGLPVLQRINPTKDLTQSLVIAPTRELCLQIAGDLADYAKYIDNLRILPVYGGSSIDSQIRALRKGVQVIVATPGRLIDLIKRGEVKLDDVHTVILDEADEMLNMGFLDDINEILAHVPQERKMLMFSATMPREIADIAKRFMHDPVEYVAGQKNEGAKNVRHIYYMVKAHDKYLALKRVADNNPDIYGIVFCRTRKETQDIADKLIADGYNADCLHGDLSQAQRDLAMKKFRDHVTRLLVATDVAARGLDVDELTHVINYGLPDDVAVYTHRSGRTGRANKSGVSIAIIHSREKGKLRQIEKIIGKTFEYKKVPTPEHIIEKQLYNLADRLERVEVDDEQMQKFLPGIRKKLEWLSEEDLLKRVLSLEFNRLLSYYRRMPNIDLDEKDKKASRKEKHEIPDRRTKDRRKAEKGYERLMLSVGKSNGFFPGNLMSLVNNSVHGPKPEIGRIDLFPDYTLFDVRKEDAHRILDALKHEDFFGDKINARIAPQHSDKEAPAKKSRKSDSCKTEPHKTEKKTTRKAAKRQARSAKADKPKYNGNYDIFIKKKR
ncbi:MAG: DEAD/DEAH box helicase [Prevotella sp.]|nr:DEAD/DEAH box helicase [Bacteroides sp.]MCM1366478.1 DEAD/DEAH box helicase [Prevotella sp.]MCM1436817.1 DEAD/DEAH box helicase [Prevotella sp.]